MWLQVDEVVASLGSQCKGSLAPLLPLDMVKTIFLWSMRVISRSLPMSSCTGDNLVSRLQYRNVHGAREKMSGALE